MIKRDVYAKKPNRRHTRVDVKARTPTRKKARAIRRKQAALMRKYARQNDAAMREAEKEAQRTMRVVLSKQAARAVDRLLATGLVGKTREAFVEEAVDMRIRMLLVLNLPNVS